MRKIFSLSLIFLVVFQEMKGATFPKEGSVLNYRLVLFSLPFENETGKYRIEVARGYITDIDSFENSIISTTKAGDKNTLVEVPDFGTKYSWRITDMSGKKIKQDKALHHFSTGYSPVVDTNIFRVRVTRHSKKCKDRYVFYDGIGLLCDMDGRPLWYLRGARYTIKDEVRDLKLSPFGTITFMQSPNIYEINYNGDTLWKNIGNPDTIWHNTQRHDFNFNHEFTRLTNGNYMVMGAELSPCSLLNNKTIATEDLIEYDTHKNIVWKWRSMDYILQSDLKDSLLKNPGFDFHDNAFYFDQVNKVIYLSFRDVNRIIKIKYPEGKVLSSYDAVVDKNGEVNAFSGQHAVKATQDGALYLFNNGRDITVDPKIFLFKEPQKLTDTALLLWEYTFDVKNILGNEKLWVNPGGGNVVQLDDQSMFISLGLRSGTSVIVGRDKELLWCGIPEVWNKKRNQWALVLDYRSSIIDRNDLEKLIWNSAAN